MPFRFTFEVAGDTQIDRSILRVGDRAVDASPAFVAIGELLIAETKEQFESEGRHGSGGWKPLKQSTVQEKKRHGFRPQILQRTGALLDSLTSRGDANMVFIVTRSGLTYGSKLPYAPVHQHPRPGNPLPRRRPLEFTEQTRREAVRILQRYLIAGEVPRA